MQAFFCKKSVLDFYAAMLFFSLKNVFLKLSATLHTMCGVVFFLSVIKAQDL